MTTLVERLLEAQVASCSCLTKTPDVQYHNPACRYRLFHEAEMSLRVMDRLDELLQTMIIGAEVFTEPDGTVTAYKIKTGALHKIVGLRTHLFFPQGMREATDHVAAVLREHWLTGLECDHDAKTDVANCFCSKWRPAPEPSVGKAVERWIEHVIDEMKRS